MSSFVFTARPNIVRQPEPGHDWAPEHRHHWFTATGHSQNVQRGLQTVQNAKVKGTYLGAHQPTYDIERQGLSRLLKKRSSRSPPKQSSSSRRQMGKGIEKPSHLPYSAYVEPDHLLSSRNTMRGRYVDKPAPGNTFMHSPHHHRTKPKKQMGPRTRFKTTFNNGRRKSLSNKYFSQDKSQFEEERIRQGLRGRVRESMKTARSSNRRDRSTPYSIHQEAPLLVASPVLHEQNSDGILGQEKEEPYDLLPQHGKLETVESLNRQQNNAKVEEATDPSTTLPFDKRNLANIFEKLDAQMTAINSAIESPTSLPRTLPASADDGNTSVVDYSASLLEEIPSPPTERTAKDAKPVVYEGNDTEVYPGFDPMSSFNNRLGGLSLYEFDE